MQSWKGFTMRPLTKKDCMDYKKVEHFALSNGCNIRNGKGDHAVIQYENNRIVYTRRDMGYGLACSIYRWFRLIGLLIIILTIIGIYYG